MLGENWIEDSKKKIQYDSEGRFQEIIQTDWNPVTEQWVRTYRIIYQY
jgi:hypothetical protein